MSVRRPPVVASGLLFLLLLGLPPLPSPVAAQVEGVVDTVPQSDEERAIAFREMFGLDATVSKVRSAAKSSDYSADPYGVPLSLEERLELARRAKVEDASVKAANVGAGEPTWAGYYFDQLNRGTPVFLFTSDPKAMRSELAPHLPDVAEFRVEQVDRSLADLMASKRGIERAYAEIRASGVHITSTGIDLITNRVTVGIQGLTDEAERAITSRFGPHIKFRERSVAQADACPLSGCRPIKVVSESSVPRARPGRALRDTSPDAPPTISWPS